MTIPFKKITSGRNFHDSQPEVAPDVLNSKGVVVGLGVVVEQIVISLIMFPFSPHTAVRQFPRPSVVL